MSLLSKATFAELFCREEGKPGKTLSRLVVNLHLQARESSDTEAAGSGLFVERLGFGLFVHSAHCTV